MKKFAHKTIMGQIVEKLKKIKLIRSLFFLILVLLIFTIPFIINELYLEGFRHNITPNTCFSAGDLLTLYGVIISGLITVTTVVITLNHNHKEYTQQIKLQMAQEKRPYFILDHVCLNDFQHIVNFKDNINTTIPCSHIELSKHRKTENDVYAFIFMKNIGEGTALVTSYSIFREDHKDLIVSQIDNDCKNIPKSPPDNTYLIELNITGFFNSTTNIKKFRHVDDINIRNKLSPNTFVGRIEYGYLNIAGVSFEQKLWLSFYITENREISFEIHSKMNQDAYVF